MKYNEMFVEAAGTLKIKGKLFWRLFMCSEHGLNFRA